MIRRDHHFGDKYYIDFVFKFPDGHRKRFRQVSPVQTRRGAEDYERQLRQSLLEERYGKKRKEPKTFTKTAEDFINVYSSTNNKPSTVEAKRQAFKKHLLPFFGHLKLDQIDVFLVEQYKSKKLKEGLSPKTVNNHLAMISKLMSLAVDWNQLETHPKITWLQCKDPDFDFFDFDETERLIKSVDKDWLPMVLTALRAGLRHSELLALRWQDIDFDRRLLYVKQNISSGIITTPKNGKSRDVPLAEDLERALLIYRHLRGELVFSDEKGHLLKRDQCKWPLWSACKRAGLRRIGWHTLRHTFASHLVIRGAPIRAVQELLGHQTIEMTLRYAHLSPESKRSAIKLLDNCQTVYGSSMAVTRKTSPF